MDFAALAAATASASRDPAIASIGVALTAANAAHEASEALRAAHGDDSTAALAAHKTNLDAWGQVRQLANDAGISMVQGAGGILHAAVWAEGRTEDEAAAAVAAAAAKSAARGETCATRCC